MHFSRIQNCMLDYTLDVHTLLVLNRFRSRFLTLVLRSQPDNLKLYTVETYESLQGKWLQNFKSLRFFGDFCRRINRYNFFRYHFLTLDLTFFYFSLLFLRKLRRFFKKK